MRKEDKSKIIEQLAAIVKEYPHFYRCYREGISSLLFGGHYGYECC